MGKFNDLTNKIFDKLTVTSRTNDYIQPNGRRLVMWLCNCECGKKDIPIRAVSLTSGNTKSCGCLHKEKALENIKKYIKENNNTYDLSGDYGIGYTNDRDIFYFDLEDYDKVKDYCWFKTDADYIRAKIKGTQRHVFLHKVVCNDIENKLIIDHKSGKCHDCRKSNLRIADASKNNMNKILQRNNTSGVVGVRWHDRDSIWEAYISINGERIYLGRHDNFDDAVDVRKEAEEKYFKEWSYDNSRNRR